MTALRFVERLHTVVVTATLTSAAWIVVGTVWVDRTDSSAAGVTTPVREAQSTRGQPSAPVGALAIPVAGVAATDLTDTFADDRGGRRHEAIDIVAPAGTPVVAAAAGTVEKLFRSEAGGNTVYVRSPDRRTIYYYAHLQAYAPGLAEGRGVNRGQRLGTVGSTGNADPAAPHLHFAVMRTSPASSWWDSATAIDPYSLLVGG